LSELGANLQIIVSINRKKRKQIVFTPCIIINHLFIKITYL